MKYDTALYTGNFIWIPTIQFRGRAVNEVGLYMSIYGRSYNGYLKSFKEMLPLEITVLACV